MENQKAETISLLNNLLKSNQDGQQIYKSAAQELQNPKIKPVFTTISQQHSKTASELEEQVRKLGGNESTSQSGRTQTKPWAEAETALKKKDERAVLEQFEKTENAIESQYDLALKQNLPSEIKEIIQKQHKTQRDTRNQIRSLRESIG